MGRKKKPIDKKVGKHHWTKGIKPNLDYLGFVYVILNKTNGMKYLGRKQFWQVRKGKRVKQADWNFYTGSSKKLNKDIDKLGISNFTFTIIKHFNTKSGLRYGESEEIIKRGCLTEYDSEGKPVWYNGKVEPSYRPVEYYQGRKRIQLNEDK